MTAKIRRARIRRVDLVDEGANQDAHILLAKNKDKGYPGKQEADPTKKPKKAAPSTPGMSAEGEGGDADIEAIRQRVREFLARQEAKGDAGDNGMGGEMSEGEKKGSMGEEPRKPRISHLSPEDFEVTSEGRNLIEWSLPEDKLPEGIEEVMISQVRAGESVRFQWMMDPLNGPPIEGTGKTADEAFTQLRAAITQQNGMDPNEGFGGLPVSGNGGGAMPAGGSEAPKSSTNSNVAKRIKLFKRVTGATVSKASAESAENNRSNSMPEIDLEALAEAIPDEVLDYIEELETENASLLSAASVAKRDDKEEDVDDLEKALNALPEDVRSIVKAQSEELATVRAALAEEQVAKSKAEWVEKARGASIIDTPEDFGDILRKFAEVDAEAAEKLMSALATASERVEKSALFSEVGHNLHIETDTEKRVEQLAKSLRDAEPEITPEEARWRVYEANPDLYDAHVADHRARVKSV